MVIGFRISALWLKAQQKGFLILYEDYRYKPFDLLSFHIKKTDRYNYYRTNSKAETDEERFESCLRTVLIKKYHFLSN